MVNLYFMCGDVQVMKNALYIFFVLLLISIFANASTASEYLEINQDNTILLKNAVFDPLKQPPASVNTGFATSQYSTDIEEYYILQFKGNVLEEWKQAVKNTGALFFDYVPNNAFIVRMNSSVKSQVEVMDIVQWVGPYQPAYKISPTFSASSISATTTTTLNLDDDVSDIIVMMFDSKHNAQVTSEIENLGGEIVDNGGEIMRVRIGTSKLSDIADMTGVSWIEKYVQPVIFNNVAADIINVSYVRNTHGLTGSGQIVAVADSGLDTGVDDHGVNGDIHLDFDNRVTFFNYYGSSPNDNNGHGTHVTGSVAGDGSESGGLYQGMAPDADIIFQGIGDDEGSNSLDFNSLTEIFLDAYNAGARIHSNSWGGVGDGAYDVLSYETDLFAWNNKDFVILFAAGNTGPNETTIDSPGTSKNAITVGASESSRFSGNINTIANFSSRGPTDDGRVKPDVVAPGTWIISTRSSVAPNDSLWGDYNSYYTYSSGTSMATPLTAGTAALVRQYYVDNESISPSAALIKATLINGAANMGLSTNDQGWGRVDIGNSLFPTSSHAIHYYDNISLTTSQSWNVSYYINESRIPLKISLVWTDRPSAPFAGKTLVNDLDLNVTGPDGSYLGNGGDSINNVEQVEIMSPTIGSYTITINGTNIPQGPQPFALVMSWGPDVYSPSASDEFPTNNSYTNNSTTSVYVNITDSGVGVNFSSIEMSINNNPVIFTNTSISNGYKIENITSTPYDDGLFTVSINASDNASNSLTYNWSFTIDTTLPVITSATANPPEIEANGTDNTLLNVTATDLHGIASVSVNLSAIGGLPDQAMTNNSGVWQLTTNTTTFGTFELPVNATDNAGNSNTSVNIALYVNDTISPTLSNNMPATGTSSLTPTISINATDIGSGINISSANMTVNSVEVLLTNTSSAFTYNFSNTTATPYSHGNKVNVTFNVSDNEGHTQNDSWEFYIDNVDPTISITSPAGGYSTTASTITVSGTVNGTGSPPVVTVKNINASTTLTNFSGTFTATLVPISLGTKTIYANVTDAAGNINSTFISVTRTAPSSSSGGGGGGGGTSGEEYENIEFKDVSRVYISANTDASFTFSETGNDIQSIKYKALTSAGYISATIEVLKNTSALVKQAPPGNVYKNMNIWVGKYGYATESNIENPVIGFKVQRSWIQDNRIDEDSIKLNRHSDEVWTALPTTRTDEDATFVYFKSQTPGFSPFAITANEKTISSQVSIKGETAAESLSPVEGQPVETTTPDHEIESVEETSMWGYLLIGALILIVAAGAYLYIRKRQS